MCSLTLKKLIFEEKNSLWRKSGHSRWKKNTTTDIWEICSHWKKTLTLDKIWFYSYWRNQPTHTGACNSKQHNIKHSCLIFVFSNFCLFDFSSFVQTSWSSWSSYIIYQTAVSNLEPPLLCLGCWWPKVLPHFQTGNKENTDSTSWFCAKTYFFSSHGTRRWFVWNKIPHGWFLDF